MPKLSDKQIEAILARHMETGNTRGDFAAAVKDAYKAGGLPAAKQMRTLIGKRQKHAWEYGTGDATQAIANAQATDWYRSGKPGVPPPLTKRGYTQDESKGIIYALQNLPCVAATVKEAEKLDAYIARNPSAAATVHGSHDTIFGSKFNRSPVAQDVAHNLRDWIYNSARYGPFDRENLTREGLAKIRRTIQGRCDSLTKVIKLLRSDALYKKRSDAEMSKFLKKHCDDDVLGDGLIKNLVEHVTGLEYKYGEWACSPREDPDIVKMRAKRNEERRQDAASEKESREKRRQDARDLLKIIATRKIAAQAKGESFTFKQLNNTYRKLFPKSFDKKSRYGGGRRFRAYHWPGASRQDGIGSPSVDSEAYVRGPMGSGFGTRKIKSATEEKLLTMLVREMEQAAGQSLRDVEREVEREQAPKARAPKKETKTMATYYTKQQREDSDKARRSLGIPGEGTFASRQHAEAFKKVLTKGGYRLCRLNLSQRGPDDPITSLRAVVRRGDYAMVLEWYDGGRSVPGATGVTVGVLKGAKSDECVDRINTAKMIRAQDLRAGEMYDQIKLPSAKTFKAALSRMQGALNKGPAAIFSDLEVTSGVMRVRPKTAAPAKPKAIREGAKLTNAEKMMEIHRRVVKEGLDFRATDKSFLKKWAAVANVNATTPDVLYFDMIRNVKTHVPGAAIFDERARAINVTKTGDPYAKREPAATPQSKIAREERAYSDPSAAQEFAAKLQLRGKTNIRIDKKQDKHVVSWNERLDSEQREAKAAAKPKENATRLRRLITAEVQKFNAHGKTLKVTKSNSGSYVLGVEGESRRRFADRLKEAQEDVDYFLEMGVLPRGAEKLTPKPKPAAKPKRAKKMTYAAARTTLTEAARRNGFEVKVGVRTYLTAPNGAFRVILKKQVVYTQDMPKSGKWGDAKEHSTAEDMRDMAAMPDTAFASWLADSKRVATKLTPTEKKEAKAKAEGEGASDLPPLNLFYSRSSGIMLDGDTKPVKDGIKAVKSPRRFRYSRRLPSPYTWYVSNSRDKHVPREVIDALAKALVEKTGREVKVEYLAMDTSKTEPKVERETVEKVYSTDWKEAIDVIRGDYTSGKGAEKTRIRYRLDSDDVFKLDFNHSISADTVVRDFANAYIHLGLDKRAPSKREDFTRLLGKSLDNLGLTAKQKQNAREQYRKIIKDTLDARKSTVASKKDPIAKRRAEVQERRKPTRERKAAARKRREAQKKALGVDCTNLPDVYDQAVQERTTDEIRNEYMIETGNDLSHREAGARAVNIAYAAVYRAMQALAEIERGQIRDGAKRRKEAAKRTKQAQTALNKLDAGSYSGLNESPLASTLSGSVQFVPEPKATGLADNAEVARAKKRLNYTLKAVSKIINGYAAKAMYDCARDELTGKYRKRLATYAQHEKQVKAIKQSDLFAAAPKPAPKPAPKSAPKKKAAKKASPKPKKKAPSKKAAAKAKRAAKTKEANAQAVYDYLRRTPATDVQLAKTFGISKSMAAKLRRESKSKIMRVGVRACHTIYAATDAVRGSNAAKAVDKKEACALPKKGGTRKAKTGKTVKKGGSRPKRVVMVNGTAYEL